MAYLALRPAGEQAPSLPATSTEEAAAVPVNAEPPAAATEGPALPAGLGGGSAAQAMPSGLGGGSSEPALPAGLGGAAVQERRAEPTTARPPELEIFKQPSVLEYMDGLQRFLGTVENADGKKLVGKSNSLVELVKTVYRELKWEEGRDPDEYYTIPDSAEAVAQCLIQYESSKRPDDLWHFVTKGDFRNANIWVQLRSGDNKDMSKVVQAVDDYVAAHPMRFEIDGRTVELEYEWFGLTYINVVWQEKMVSGMLKAFLGSFLVVLLMMIVLFRSALWGLLSMIPLTITIALIYGVIGMVGKDYDMPVAVLSSLTLGLAVDFAIHFLVRARAVRAQHGTWAASVEHVFGEPARAIFRNIIVIAIGFLPLLAAPLVPYNTVGVFLAAILFVSGAGTMLILPALMRYLEPLLFPATKVCSLTCQCGTCIVSSIAAVALVAVNVNQFLNKGWTELTWYSLGALVVLVIWCFLASRRQKCRAEAQAETDANR